MKIPYSRPAIIGNEEKYVMETLQSGKWSGRGLRTTGLESLVRNMFSVKHAFFVTSGTSALEVGAILSGVGSGDEVIVPSFGFTSTVNCIVGRGATPVFADIDPETWNLSVETVEPLITPKTKALVPIHYAGSVSGIQGLRDLCAKNEIFLIEDAAQSVGARWKGRPVGSTQDVTCFSLHDTKNVAAGEGGLVCTDNDDLALRAEIIIEKGTDRQKFLRGQVDKYSWVDYGSSYVASEILASVALAQIEKLNLITERRVQIWNHYKDVLGSFEGRISFQSFDEGVEHNGHIFGFCVPVEKRDAILADLNASGVGATFHYVPLHSSSYSKKMGWMPGRSLPHTDNLSNSLIRLPIYWSLREPEVHWVSEMTRKILNHHLD